MSRRSDDELAKFGASIDDRLITITKTGFELLWVLCSMHQIAC